MYELVDSLNPDRLYEIAKVAYGELRTVGVRTVAEFHYVHHQPGGLPYAERTVMADALIQAARETGLRICLLRVAYERAGAGGTLVPAQRRFCDPSVDEVLFDVETLRRRYAGDPNVRIGLAPHSVRAVSRAWLRHLATHAARERLPIHMHVAEQPLEVAECLAETGRRPVELLSELGVLGQRFVAVHATHLEPHEVELLGKARARVCICATTERDLGDGLPNIGAMRRAGVSLCTGVDSHVLTDPFEDMRALEYLERLRSGRRATFGEPGENLARALWNEASVEGARAAGFDDAGGEVLIDASHPQFELVDESNLLDAVVFGSTTAVVVGIDDG